MSQTVDGHKISDKGTSLPVIFLGILASIQVADPVVASLALVKATKALNFSPSMQAIAASISTLALAATVVPTGVLADKIGRRKVLILSLLLTAVGDGIAAAAPNSYVFLVGRAIAGIGLGGVFACSFGFIRSMVTDKALAPALGIFAAMAALPLFVIMPLGSALAGVNWRLAFVLIVVLALIGAALCFPLLPDLAPVAEGVKKQYWGLTALGVGIVGLLIGLSGAAKSLTAPSTLLPLAIGILGLGLFALIESKVAVPTYPVSLFKSPLFLVGAIGGFAWNAVSAVATLMSSNLWQYVDGFTPLQASIRQLAGIVATIIASVIAGRVMGKGKSSVGVLVVGGFITMVGLALTGVFAGDSSGLLFLAMLSLAFFGCGVMTVPQSQMFVQESPKEYYGPVTSSRTCVGQLAYAIGLALGAAIASSVMTSLLVSDKGLSSAEATSETQKFLTGGATTVSGIKEFYTTGFTTAMFIFAGLVGVCIVLVLLLGRKASARSNAHADTAAAAAA